MENPLVSVFMPVFNCEKYIKESLESILNQTYSNLEILIIDDGSTDNTIEIISSYNDKRIRLLKNGENKGIPFTRNRGLEESKGKYMAIMDADDIAFLNRIERQVNYMEVNKDIDVVASYFNIFGGRIKKSYKPKLFSPEEISAKLIFSNPIGNSTAFIRLETIKINKLKYNANYFVAQDYDMWVQISKVGKISILPEILLEYRISSNNITKKSTKNSLLQRKRVIDSIHNDILFFHNFKLTKEELSVFNEFFCDNNNKLINIDILSNLPRILKKLIEQNKINNLFNEEAFIKIIKQTVLINVNNLNLTFNHKVEIYNNVCRDKSNVIIAKEMIYMITIHLYKLILQLRSKINIVS